MTPNSITTTETTAAHWDWIRRALTVPLEAFVMLKLQHFTFEPTQEQLTEIIDQTTEFLELEPTQILPMN
ncbi:hypothetical protein ACPDQ4_003383 [Vibrio cholerae]|uniref:hypothetical protein n=1 Tax=Vibrio cholerae TaxID=666 RepID=UPI000AD73AB6